MFLSIFRPLNSLQISKRLRLLDSLKVSKHFIRPLSSLFPSPGLRHVAYARPLGGVMLLMRPRGPAPGCAPGGPGLDPLMLMMRALWGPPWRRKKPRKKKPFTGGTRGSAALASGPILLRRGRRSPMLGPWGPRAARFNGYRQCCRPQTGGRAAGRQTAEPVQAPRFRV